MKNSALVVIDLQNDITKNYREIIDRVNQAIDWAAGRDMHVVYIQHNNLSAGTRTFKPDTRGAELVPEMKVVSNNTFVKTKSNALTSGDFAGFIEEHGITEFFVAGADATACVKSTCFNMKKRGTPFMCCATASPATIKRSCPKCLRIMKARGARWRSFKRSWDPEHAGSELFAQAQTAEDGGRELEVPCFSP